MKKNCSSHEVCNWIRYDKEMSKVKVDNIEKDKPKIGIDEQQEKDRIFSKVKWKDEEIVYDDNSVEIATFGNVTLNEDEKAFLRNPPDYALYGKLDDDDMKVEIEVGLAKVGLNRRSTGYGEEEKEEQTDESKKNDENIEIEDAMNRMIYNYETMTIDFGKRRPTDCRNNRRTILPKARTIKEEAELLIRKEEWLDIIKKYKNNNCKENGDQKIDNLTKQERIGMASIKKRVANNEIVIQISDKCKKLCVSTLEEYKKQGREHTKNCKIVGWEKIRETNKNINGTSKAMSNIFSVGTDGPEESAKRTWANFNSESCEIPSMRISPKLHKDLNKDGSPKTRAIVGAGKCMAARGSEILSDAIEAFTEGEESIECSSTEDMLAQMNRAEAIIKTEKREIISGSADIVNLFPSIKKKIAGQDIFEMVMKSKVKLENINYESAAIYIATTCTRAEIYNVGLSRVVPIRRFKRGPTPGLTNPELTKRNLSKAGEAQLEKDISNGKKAEVEHTTSVWRDIPKDMSDLEKRTLIAMAMKVGVMEIMGNHMFEFGGQTFLQSDGGSIGLRLTGAISRVVMDKWANKLKGKMEENKIECKLMTKYVDDLNFYIEALELGTYWEGGSKGKVKHSDEKESRDITEGRTKSETTMQVIKDMGESCNNWIKLTVDTEEKHENYKIPMLDVEVWRVGKCEIRHQFYEKKVASNRVIGAKSAMPENTKIATLSQEIVRRMQNTGRDVDEQNRVKILDDFMIKLSRSKYNEKQRMEILKSGLNGYYNKVIRENKGGEKINRDSRKNRGMRKVQKIIKKDKWHQRKKDDETNIKQTNKHRGSNKRKAALDEINEKQTTESVIFVPVTPFGQLKRELQKWDDKYSRSLNIPRIKFMEKSGTKLKQIICKTNPWANRSCEQEKWEICKSSEQKDLGTCRYESITYQIKCIQCEKDGVKSSYLGESSRTLYERLKEHLDGEACENKENALWKHDVNHHRGIKQEYSAKVIGRIQNPMKRQVTDKVLIERESNRQRLLNSKNEWGGEGIPRITIENNKEREKEKDEQEVKEHLEPNKSRKRNMNEGRTIAKNKIAKMFQEKSAKLGRNEYEMEAKEQEKSAQNYKKGTTAPMKAEIMDIRYRNKHKMEAKEQTSDQNFTKDTTAPTKAENIDIKGILKIGTKIKVKSRDRK